MQRRIVRTACLVVLLAYATPRAPAQGEDPAASGDLRRGSHSGLWPFYSREDYEDGSHRQTSLFGLQRSESLSNGDFRHRLIPVYESSVTDSARDRRLTVYPLLYFSRESPHASYNLSLPFFASWRDDLGADTLLWPFVHVASSRESDPFRFIPTLFSHGDWHGGSAQRLGLPYVLDIFERLESHEESAWTAGAIIPWGPPTRFGVPLAKSYESRTHGNWHLHVFPFFCGGEGPTGEESFYVQTPLYGTWRSADETQGHSLPLLLSWWWSGENSHATNVLFPLIQSKATKERVEHRFLPFYAVDRMTDGSYSDIYLPLALAGYRTGSKGTAIDLLWPLLHRSRSEKQVATRVLPFYDSLEREGYDSLGVGGILYRRHRDESEARTTHWYLFPLGRRETSKTGHRNWLLPLYLDMQYETEDTRTATQLYGPFYFSRVTDELTSSGEWRTTRQRTHAWPFYGEHRFRPLDRDVDIRKRWILAPFFRRVETSSAESSSPEKVLTDIPWPIAWHERTPDSWRFGVVPLLFGGSSSTRSYFRLYPLLWIDRGPEAQRSLLAHLNVFQWYDDSYERNLRIAPWIFQWRKTPDVEELRGPLWLFGHRDARDEGSFHLFPIGFGSWEGEKTEFGLFPAFYRRDFDEGALVRWTLGRFFFVWNSLRNRSESYDSFLWKAFEYSRSDAGAHDFRILHRLFVHREVGGQKELTVNPLFSVSSDARTGDSTFRILGFLYRKAVRDGETTHSVLGVSW